MAIIETKMVSGWAVDKTTLIALLSNDKVRLRRYEVDENGAVQLYFDSVSIITGL